MKTPISNSLRTVLLVDSIDTNRILSKWFLSNMGYTVDSAKSAEEALALFDPRIHDIVLTDNFLPGMSGSEMAHIIKLRSSSTPVVMHASLIPENKSCLDMIFEKSVHLLAVKEAMDALLEDKTLLQNQALNELV